MTTPFVTDFASFFSEAQVLIAAVRAGLGLPALVPNGKILIGQEYLAREHDAPRIVVVPIGAAYEGAKPMQARTGYGAPPDRKYAWFRGLTFSAHFWGNPDPAGADEIYDLSSAIELEREFCSSMSSVMTSTKLSFYPTAGQWKQGTANETRRGRVFEMDFVIGTPVTFEPYTILPYSQTAGDGGVVRDVTMTISPPDGSAPQNVGPIVIPS